MATSNADHEIVIVREFAAPRQLVWQAFTDPVHVAKWFGPRGFTTRVEQLDLRPGGRTKYVMVGPDGGEYPCGGTFLEIVPGERIVSTDEFGEDFVAPPGVDLPQGMVVTYLFDDAPGGKTRLTLRIAHPTAEDRAKHEAMGVVGGWQSSFDKLAELFGEAPTTDREIVIERLLAAPPGTAFAAFAEPAGLSNWWGPRGFRTTTHAMDFRPGGEWRFTMHGPDGTDYPNRVVYREIAAGERLAYDHADAVGHGGFHVTITFAAEDGGTRIRLRMLLPTAAEREGMAKFGAVEGGVQTLGRLADALAGGNAKPALTVALPSPTEIVLTREFVAPRQLVFDALTKPEHVRHWWGLRGSELTTCEADIRVGGPWRYVLKMPTGQECRFHGEYLELDPPGRMVSTETFDEPAIGSPSYRVTVTLTEENGRTTLVSRIQHPTNEARDGHLHSGMPRGAAETFDRLAELLAGG